MFISVLKLSNEIWKNYQGRLKKNKKQGLTEVEFRKSELRRGLSMQQLGIGKRPDVGRSLYTVRVENT